MEEERASRLRTLLYRRNRSCCYKHLLLLLNESVGMPFTSLSHVNFLECLDCRQKQHNTDSPAVAPSPAPSLSSDSSSSLLDAFFHEFSAAAASRASKRATRAYTETKKSSKRSARSAHAAENKEEKDDDDGACGDGDALIRAPAGTSSNEPIPHHLLHHLLLGDAVLSHIPLCDIVRARFVSRTWMNSIDAFLRNPGPHAHPYLRRPCLMLLHPASTKIGANASLAVFDLSLNSWLPKPILFPSNASFLVGASRGLFCFATGKPNIANNVDFFVGNPLFGTWTCLPRPPLAGFKCSCWAFVAHVISQGSAGELGYKLLLLELCTKKPFSKTFLMYNSCTKAWRNLDKNIKVNFQSFYVEHFFFEASGLVHCFNRCGLKFWSYNLLTNKLQGVRQRNAEFLPPQYERENYQPYGYRLPYVLRCADSFFNVCRMRRSGDECAAVGLIPWVLHLCPIGIFGFEDNARWVLVSTMPPNLLKQAVEEGSDGTDFVIGTDHARRIFFILRGSSKMLMYDVLSSIWEALPGCPIGHSFYPYKLCAFFEPLL